VDHYVPTSLFKSKSDGMQCHIRHSKLDHTDDKNDKGHEHECHSGCRGTGFVQTESAKMTDHWTRIPMRAVSGLVVDHGSQEKNLDQGSVTVIWMNCRTRVSGGAPTLQGPALPAAIV